MRFVRLKSRTQILRISRRLQNDFSKEFERGFRVNSTGDIFNEKFLTQAGEIIEVLDLNSFAPIDTSPEQAFIRHELIDEEIFADEYPEYFL